MFSKESNLTQVSQPSTSTRPEVGQDLTFLSSVEEGSILGRVSDLDDLGSGEQLHDQAGRDDGRDAELHQGAAIRRQDHADPVKWIGRVRTHDAEERDLEEKC